MRTYTSLLSSSSPLSSEDDRESYAASSLSSKRPLSSFSRSNVPTSISSFYFIDCRDICMSLAWSVRKKRVEIQLPGHACWKIARWLSAKRLAVFRRLSDRDITSLTWIGMWTFDDQWLAKITVLWIGSSCLWWFNHQWFLYWQAMTGTIYFHYGRKRESETENMTKSKRRRAWPRQSSARWHHRAIRAYCEY